MRLSLARLAAAGAAVALAAFAIASHSPVRERVGPDGIRALYRASTAPAHHRHVIVIVEENKAYDQVMGHAPYQTSVAKKCGYAANMHAETYPSLPTTSR